ncbi:bifunctional 2-polyprenyl-6-hydroxyphenol methylase/3-demethylubiquinol 3-O-methyltransferase UbiG [Isoptericola variabilis]|uniref:Methyltransferase type 11 n=1 Tax=Isoptericola variabilis (strain 225) TaxID=743718 RepID=F6FS29_ISOV2|nr:class I SAM-dependent methyltransferase [Isoptericola variabilis]AEG45126.1 Methyltransferase type 11 [Isoptericola variabilis 225]TWH32232.1 methyltransferase family protein [Isoptericola variabilis J7]
MSQYETVVDMSNRNSSQTLEVEMVGEGKTVLDVGCASGYLADALNERGCTVSGVERDPAAAETARPKLASLVVGDVEELDFAEAFEGATFDRIVFGDVLEHLVDPARVLRSALDVLADDGEVIISVPNVTHGSLRLALLSGRWRYTDEGLLDRTHVRFFTWSSLVELVSDAGLVVREAWSTNLDPLGTEVDVDGESVPPGVVDWVRHQPRALDYQFVVRASRGTPDGEVPEVRPAVPYGEARFEDSFTEQARALAEEKHQTLVLRDYVLGLEAQVARAAKELERVTSESEADRTRLERLVDDLVKERDAMRKSVTWKVGRLLMTPVRLAKRAVAE